MDSVNMNKNMNMNMDMKEVLNSFAGKRVFVTGHTGFKGSWLTFLLNELGADVMGFALPPEPGQSHFKLLKLQTSIRHVVGDIRDAIALKEALHSFQPEYVFHLAAQALVKQSYADPAATFDTNVLGSVHLLEAVRQCDSVRSLVYITSDKCYENVEWLWGYRENDLLGGHDPYSASKAAAEIVFSAYARSYFDSRPELGAATTRAGNVIGGGDWAADRIVPDCIRALEMNRPIRLRNPGATRPWQHVLEPLSGYLLLAERLHDQPVEYAGSWNFGPPAADVRTVQDVADAIVQHLGRGRVETTESEPQHHEARLLQLNCDKAHQLLGWYPRWQVDKTLEATAQWYKVVIEGGNAKSITRTQIKDYFPELS
jgi:CDP-glucose 4,6-dehydratase